MKGNISKQVLLLLALTAAFLNIIPLLLVIPAGDAVMNYMQVDCFSKQLWAGIYPRWCMDANGGMGSPAPIFYFPLPFIIPALFAPLRSFGLTNEAQYLIGIYLANVTAFLCCTLWLSRIVSSRVAVFCAFLFLFGFYRAEMIARASYAEYWCVAFLPLLFLYVREACHSRFKNSLKLALIITICLFCHAPMTLIGLMGAGLYMLFFNWRVLIELAIATMIAAMISAFHYVPMRLLTHTLNDEMGGVNHWRRSWVNSFVNQPQLYADHTWALIGSSVGLIAVLFAFAVFSYKHSTLPDNVKREGLCWIVIASVSLFMMFSLSAPLWHLIEMISGVATPWRMQALILLALILVIAILAEYTWFQNPKTRTGDMLLGAMFFIFSSLFYAGGVDKKSFDIQRRHILSQFSTIYFSTRDMDKRYRDIELFFKDFIDRPNRQQAEWVQGSGVLKVEQWDAQGIIISIHADRAGILRLEHFYYPIWRAILNEAPIAITPEPISGRMIIAIPKGDFSLRLAMDYWGMLSPAFTKQ